MTKARRDAKQVDKAETGNGQSDATAQVAPKTVDCDLINKPKNPRKFYPMSKDAPKNAHDLAGDCKENTFDFSTVVTGLDMDGEVTLDTLLQSFSTTGIQASNIHKAILEIRRMREANAKIFLGCTSNMTSCGIREIIKFLAKHSHIDVYVTTAGGIEEDLMKCKAPTYLADFKLDGKELREQGWNRIGNMVVHNRNYYAFEQFMTAFLNEIVLGKEDAEFNTKNGYVSLMDDHRLVKKVIRDDGVTCVCITPSEIIRLLGKKINDKSSILHWCYLNGIRVYSTAITDGSLGDMVTFFPHRDQLIIDICADIHNLNWESIHTSENGAIICGGGLIKHMIFNANLFNNGLEYCVLVNTGIEHEASDAGADISEAYSWGKVKPNRNCVKVWGEASICFPLVVYGGFKSMTDFSSK
ncbi:DHYS [Enterospora canceri]|uniref:deoxyhypusine synthase n=1 Tax=Enterospora canceri TaxID=1081671 RepID=A0A1Y1S9B4_9MICR|nr:DHYS [Enterospora canceri]